MSAKTILRSIAVAGVLGASLLGSFPVTGASPAEAGGTGEGFPDAIPPKYPPFMSAAPHAAELPVFTVPLRYVR